MSVKVAHWGGFEPPTPRFVVWCSSIVFRCLGVKQSAKHANIVKYLAFQCKTILIPKFDRGARYEGCPSPLPHQRTSLSTVAPALYGVTGRSGAFVHGEVA